MLRFFEKVLPSEKQDTRLKVCGFGKFPNHGDFVRYHLASRETTTFEKWLQEGVSCITRKYPKGWPDLYREFPCHNFVMTGSEQEHNLIGTLVGSRDKSGRTYPFATLALVNGALFHNHRAALPLTCSTYFKGAQRLIASLTNIASAKALGEQLEKLSGHFQAPAERELLAQRIKTLSEHSMQEYWHGLPKTMATDDRERLFFALFDFLRTVAKRGASKSHWGVRLPLPDVIEPLPFVIFWVQMIEAILENRFWRAHYFWNFATPGQASHLTLFFRPLPPSHLLSLLDINSKDNVIFDVMKESQNLPNFTSNIDLRRLLDKETTPLVDVLYRIGRRESLS